MTCRKQGEGSRANRSAQLRRTLDSIPSTPLILYLKAQKVKLAQGQRVCPKTRVIHLGGRRERCGLPCSSVSQAWVNRGLSHISGRHDYPPHGSGRKGNSNRPRKSQSFPTFQRKTIKDLSLKITRLFFLLFFRCHLITTTNYTLITPVAMGLTN